MNFSQVTQYCTQRERYLLTVSGLFLLLTALTLGIVQKSLWPPLILLAIWSASAFAGHNLLNQILPQRDPLLFPIAMLLTGWGLALILRLAPVFAWRQALWLAVSLVAMLAISTLPTHLRWLRRYRYTWLFGGLCLLLVTIMLGVNPSGFGPRLWLGLGGLYFQPSELLKLMLVIFLASYLADYHEDIHLAWKRRRWIPSFRAMGPLLLMWGLCTVMTIWQRDLGTAALFFIVFLTMLYIASQRTIYVVLGLAMLLLASVAAYHLYDVVELRIDVWLNPWAEAGGRGYQIVQSLIAFSAGGMFGQGIGMGAPQAVPVVQSDFIFAAVGEEWGLVGAVNMIICLAVLTMRGMQIASLWTASPFRMLLAAGLSVLLATQSLLILGGVLKLIPLTGVTLPFVSYGGSSLLINFILIGLFLVLSSPSASQEDDLT